MILYKEAPDGSRHCDSQRSADENSFTGTFSFLQDICSLSLAFPCTIRESIESIQNCAVDRMQINGGGGGVFINNKVFLSLFNETLAAVLKMSSFL